MPILAFVSLLLIAGVIIRNFLNNKPDLQQNQDTSDVLGESTENSPTAIPLFSLNYFNNIIRGKINETKNDVENTVNTKVAETEKKVIENIQKEVSTLTDAQIQNLKIQICRDLGVLPTLTPKP